MNTLYTSRILKMNNLEIFEVQLKRYGKFLGYLAFVDFNRPSTLNDYPYLQGIETEDEFYCNSNFIKAIFISSSPLHSEQRIFLEEFTDSFIGNKEDCAWNIDFIEKQFNSSNTTINDIIYLYKQVLKINYNMSLDITCINPVSFNHLSQYE